MNKIVKQIYMVNYWLEGNLDFEYLGFSEQTLRRLKSTNVYNPKKYDYKNEIEEIEFVACLIADKNMANKIYKILSLIQKII